VLRDVDPVIPTPYWAEILLKPQQRQGVGGGDEGVPYNNLN